MRPGQTACDFTMGGCVLVCTAMKRNKAIDFDSGSCAKRPVNRIKLRDRVSQAGYIPDHKRG
jgi:hypothetical protein